MKGHLEAPFLPSFAVKVGEWVGRGAAGGWAGGMAQGGGRGEAGPGWVNKRTQELFCTTRLARCEHFHAKVLTQ